MSISMPNHAPPGFEKDLPPGFMTFYEPLHHLFTPRQQLLARVRRQVLARAHAGHLPQHPTPSAATVGEWRIDLPGWCRDQRNQMTGPADDAELVVKLLNAGAPGVMLDLEDSMVNAWPHTLRGTRHIVQALHGELRYTDPKRGEVAIRPSTTVIWNRVRGLHMSQGGIFDTPTSASLFDLALIVFQVDRQRLRHPLAIYIPKSESAEEALWWRDVFQAMAAAKGWPAHEIKCMALVESHPLAFQIEEFTYNLRDHLLGLNLGRWDYMASLIHYNLNDPAWVLPDRNTIPHDVPFFQNLRLLIPEICHKRGILAVGGMTALYPSRDDAEQNARALAVLEKDKQNEAACLMDGAWTGHPDQNEIAVRQFPAPNQLHARNPKTSRYPDLRPPLAGAGARTVDGTRAAVRTAIRYRAGVLAGKGASLLDGYMEDLATDRIYRLMIAQRLRHCSETKPGGPIIVDGSGQPAPHTRAFVSGLFNEELHALVAALPKGAPLDAAQQLREARRLTEEAIFKNDFDPA